MHEGMGGKHAFAIKITSNDPVQPEKELMIYANFVAPGAPTATATATPTATATWTPTPTYTPTPVATPALTLYRQYPWLIWYASNLGLPGQVLTGTLTRAATPVPGAVIRLRATTPGGSDNEYWILTDAWGVFQLDSLSASDPNLGSTERGTWGGQAFYDTGGQSSSGINWEVEWFIIHLID